MDRFLFWHFADEDISGLTEVFIHDKDMDWLYKSDGNIFSSKDKHSLEESINFKFLGLFAC